MTSIALACCSHPTFLPIVSSEATERLLTGYKKVLSGYKKDLTGYKMVLYLRGGGMQHVLELKVIIEYI